MIEPPSRTHNPAYTIYHLVWALLDWIYPPVCGGCQKPGSRWCMPCRSSLERIGPDTCPICGQPQRNREICSTCLKNPPPYKALSSYATYQGPLREAIHSLKYQKDIGIGEALAGHLVEAFNERNWKIDVVTSVPLSRNRILQRGYNQASVLARPLSLFIKKPYCPQALRRIRETPPQVGLTGMERRQNLYGAFQANPRWTLGRTFLVIDDVTTTGATIQACSEALLQSGAAAVYGLTLARAGKHLTNADGQAGAM